MNVPIAPPANAMVVARAPLNHFAASLTNRKHTPEHIAALGESIKDDGVIQPILARPWPASRGPAPKGVLYEIVIGEGRWLGSDWAKQADIPFFWRDLDDKQAIKLQLVENLKRKDLSAIEEAEGYRRLMKDHGLSAEQVAKEIGVKGKSKSYVYARLKLLDLKPTAMRIFAAGELDASTALLVARIPNEKLQIEAAKKLSEKDWTGRTMSYRQAAEFVQRTYMLKLADAPFPRASIDLVPSAGRCHDCPKRTGNAPELFDDVKSADICTDPPCYEAKKGAHIEAQRKLAQEQGRKIIDGNEARKIKPHSYDDDLAGGYMALDHTLYKDGKQTTLRKVLGDQAPKADILMDPHHKGDMIDVVATASIGEILKNKGYDNELRSAARATDHQKERQAEDRKHKLEVTFRQRLFDLIRSKLTEDFEKFDANGGLLEDDDYQLIAATMFQRTMFEDQKRMARLWIGPRDKKQSDHDLVHELGKRIETMDRADASRLLLELAVVGQVGVSTYGSGTPEKLIGLAKSLQIDADALKVEIRKEATEKEKLKNAKTKPANADGKPKAVQPQTAKPVAANPGETPANPTPAAQAPVKSAAEAAPAKVKNPKTSAAKKTKTKADPAPATPANEPPTAAKATPAPWPFPVGNRPAAQAKSAA